MVPQPGPGDRLANLVAMLKLKALKAPRPSNLGVSVRARAFPRVFKYARAEPCILLTSLAQVSKRPPPATKCKRRSPSFLKRFQNSTKHPSSQCFSKRSLGHLQGAAPQPPCRYRHTGRSEKLLLVQPAAPAVTDKVPGPEIEHEAALHRKAERHQCCSSSASTY